MGDMLDLWSDCFETEELTQVELLRQICMKLDAMEEK